MYLFAYIACLLMPANKTPGFVTISDTTGIYRTREDFLNSQVSFLSPGKTKVKAWPFWRSLPLNIDSDEHIYIRQANGSEKRILPDSTFGFITNGIQYVYIPREKRYLAVLNDKAPVFLLIKEKYIPFKGIDFVDDSLLYTRNLGMPLKACTMSNIRQDFGDNPELVNQFSLLLKAIIKKGFDGEVHRKSFLKYRQLIRQYLGAAAS